MIEAKKDERGRWCVFIDGKFVSDHRDHVGARRAAQNHVPITPKAESTDG
jgi:hypothetical protein